jgi:4-hydroxybenzoate polyprenyltransferase
MLMHVWLSVTSIGLAVMVSMKVTLVVTVCVLLLWLYSVTLKRQFLTGNVAVALVSACVVLILPLYDHHTPLGPVILYACFAFGISLIREIIKDAEDVQGDSRFSCRTIPIVLGMPDTRRLLILFTGIFLGFIAAGVAWLQGSWNWSYAWLAIVFAGYMLFAVMFPLAFLIYRLISADTRRAFSELSSLAKLIMLTGLMSVIFLR